MRSATAISIVVPTLNEVDNVHLLLQRIDASMVQAGVTYEVIFVDDHSTDGTVKKLRSLSTTYPLSIHLKRGTRGKANSLQQGFRLAQYDIIGMIDADLQYPPEAIVEMLEMLTKYSSDVVITNRVDNETSRLRKLSSTVFNYLFVKLLFGFDYDTQSGLKIFRKSVIKTINLTPRNWSFDLEFIVRALEENYRIMQIDIPFGQRHSGEAKINLLSSTFELATQSLKLRFNSSRKIVRESYQSNDRFVKRIYDLLIIAIVLAGVSSFAQTQTAQALSLPLPSPSASISQLAAPITGDASTPSPSPSPSPSPTPIITLPQTDILTTGTTSQTSTSGTVATTDPQSSSTASQPSNVNQTSTATDQPVGVTTAQPKTLIADNGNATVLYPAGRSTGTGKALYADNAASKGLPLGVTISTIIVIAGGTMLVTAYALRRQVARAAINGAGDAAV